jgi:hypothetical protein
MAVAMIVIVRTCMAVSFGAWLALCLWLITASPWAGVFAAGTGLGMMLVECSNLQACKTSLEADVMELEKQVVALRTTLARVMRREEESVEDARARFRHRARPGSSSSL